MARRLREAREVSAWAARQTTIRQRAFTSRHATPQLRQNIASGFGHQPGMLDFRRGLVGTLQPTTMPMRLMQLALDQGITLLRLRRRLRQRAGRDAAGAICSEPSRAIKIQIGGKFGYDFYSDPGTPGSHRERKQDFSAEIHALWPWSNRSGGWAPIPSTCTWPTTSSCRSSTTNCSPNWTRSRTKGRSSCGACRWVRRSGGARKAWRR